MWVQCLLSGATRLVCVLMKPGNCCGGEAGADTPCLNPSCLKGGEFQDSCYLCIKDFLSNHPLPLPSFPTLPPSVSFHPSVPPYLLLFLSLSLFPFLSPCVVKMVNVIINFNSTLFSEKLPSAWMAPGFGALALKYRGDVSSNSIGLVSWAAELGGLITKA